MRLRVCVSVCMTRLAATILGISLGIVLSGCAHLFNEMQVWFRKYQERAVATAQPIAIAFEVPISLHHTVIQIE